MKSLNKNYYSRPFSHIYVENKIKDNDTVVSILHHFKDAQIIYINHYKDIFCRANQNYIKQQASHTLILARKSGTKVYKGSPVCQSFDNDYFFYTSCMMNCIYNCEYCYLKGMYQSGYMVLFINLDEIFDDVTQLLKAHPVYLCVSYDTDMMAMESIFHLAKKWCDYVDRTNQTSSNKLTIEIRTKCGTITQWNNIHPSDNVIFAFTLSPEYVINNYEHGTSSLKARIDCAKNLISNGFRVRLCFDPMIHCPDWKSHYTKLLDDVIQSIDLSKLYDVSIGSFRISKDYLKQMRKIMTNSIAYFPYENTDGFYHYPSDLQNEMEQFLFREFAKYISPDKIFLWKE